MCAFEQSFMEALKTEFMCCVGDKMNLKSFVSCMKDFDITKLKKNMACWNFIFYTSSEIRSKCLKPGTV